MATLRNKKKVTAFSRETPENTRNTQPQNTLYPVKTQECISQVSEEIDGRFTKKLSKEFCRTESLILGAFSKLDEFLLNAQFRTCSVAVPGTSRNNDAENREPTGDRSLGDSCLEALFFTYNSSNLITRDSSHGDTSSRRDFLSSSHVDWGSSRVFLLLPCNFVRKTNEGAPYKSVTISQSKHPCNN